MGQEPDQIEDGMEHGTVLRGRYFVGPRSLNHLID